MLCVHIVVVILLGLARDHKYSVDDAERLRLHLLEGPRAAHEAFSRQYPQPLRSLEAETYAALVYDRVRFVVRVQHDERVLLLVHAVEAYRHRAVAGRLGQLTMLYLQRLVRLAALPGGLNDTDESAVVYELHAVALAFREQLTPRRIHLVPHAVVRFKVEVIDRFDEIGTGPARENHHVDK